MVSSFRQSECEAGGTHIKMMSSFRQSEGEAGGTHRKMVSSFRQSEGEAGGTHRKMVSHRLSDRAKVRLVAHTERWCRLSD